MLSLERSIGADVPTHHPVMTWLVPHAAEVLSKYLVSVDGKTPFERHFGKKVAETGSVLVD